MFFLLVAVFEEILMRGYILGRLLHTRLNKFLSLFISASLFAFLHIFNPEINALPMINLLLAGMLLASSFISIRLDGPDFGHRSLRCRRSHRPPGGGAAGEWPTDAICH